MNKIGVCAFALALCCSCVQTDNKSGEAQQLVWSEEFDYSGAPDSMKWGYDLGDGCPTLCGWGNNELQHYTNDSKNVRVEDGKLVIEVHKDRSDTLRKYSSARLTSKNKADWKYGYIEIKAKLPEGKGTWPAIWMLPTEWKYGDWPRSGEIDIMEHVGYDQNTVHGTVHTMAYNHTKGTQKGKSIEVEQVADTFNLYAIKWTPDKIDFMVNGEVYNTFKNENKSPDEWPFDQEFHLIMNIAVGGNWGGQEGIADNIWPQRMVVDYVRAYKLPQLSASSE